MAIHVDTPFYDDMLRVVFELLFAMSYCEYMGCRKRRSLRGVWAWERLILLGQSDSLTRMVVVMPTGLVDLRSHKDSTNQ
jgi:hypothetical protein